MFKLFKKYLRPYLGLLFASVILIGIEAISQLILPDIMANIVNEGIMNSNIPYIFQEGAKMLLVSILSGACLVASGLFSAKAGMGFGKDTRRAIFQKVETFMPSEFDKFGASSLITRTTNDVTQVQNSIIMMLRAMVSGPFMLIGGVISITRYDYTLTGVLLCAVPLLFMLFYFISKNATPIFKSMQKKIDKLSLVFREYLTGIRVIRAFDREKDEQRRFKEASWDLAKSSMKVHRIMSLNMPGMMLLMNFTSIFIVWVGAKSINRLNMQVGDLMAVIQYATQIMGSLMMFGLLFVMIPRASVSASRINEVLEQNPSITNEGNMKIGDIKTGEVLSFENVTFYYPGAESPVLENITFTACRGETVAIVGGTGSGKSTLVNLIPRFYDVTEGSIKINGVDIKKIPQDELRKSLGVVPQKALLFSGTIKDNILFGKEDATDEEVINALKISEAWDFVKNLPGGINSFVSQGGTNYSGGQKQRLSIARALVRKPAIYIFDDSFSALDAKTDANLRRNLREVLKDSTIIIVAQKITSIMDADKIIVLDEGKIAGIGKHDELYNICSTYREIVDSQIRREG